MNKVMMWLSGSGFVINLLNLVVSIYDDRYDKVWFFFLTTIMCGTVFMFLREESKTNER